MGNPKGWIELEGFLQSRHRFIVTPGVMQKHSLERTEQEKDRVELYRTRTFDDSLVVASQIGQNMSKSKMGVRRIRVQRNGGSGLPFPANPIPFVPNKAE